MRHLRPQQRRSHERLIEMDDEIDRRRQRVAWLAKASAPRAIIRGERAEITRLQAERDAVEATLMADPGRGSRKRGRRSRLGESVRKAVELRLTDLAGTFRDEPTRFDREIEDLRAAIQGQQIWLAVWRAMNLQENWGLALPQPDFDSLRETVSDLEQILKLTGSRRDAGELRRQFLELMRQVQQLQSQHDQRLSKLREAALLGGRPRSERPLDATLSDDVQKLRRSRPGMTQTEACRQIATRRSVSVSTVQRAVRANRERIAEVPAVVESYRREKAQQAERERSVSKP